MYKNPENSRGEMFGKERRRPKTGPANEMQHAEKIRNKSLVTR